MRVIKMRYQKLYLALGITILFLISIFLVSNYFLKERIFLSPYFPNPPETPSSPGNLCSDECLEGETRCDGSLRQICGYNEDECLKWTNDTNCDNGCSNGECISCTNDCQINGNRVCEGGGYRECGNYDGDECLEWSSVTDCREKECFNGVCKDICEEEDWRFELIPEECPVSEIQFKDWEKIGDCVSGVSHQDENVSCNYTAPICESFQYSEWSECGESGVRTREVLSKSPENCESGNPKITEQCNYVPECGERNWEFELIPEDCPVSGEQEKRWWKVGKCEGGINYENETINCNYASPVCQFFNYSEWSECRETGIMVRSILSKFPENCEGGNPNIQEQCNYQGCSSGQIEECESINNGEVKGYRDICGENGWTGEDTCNYTCNSGYIRDGGRCVGVSHKKKLKRNDLRFVKKGKRVMLKEENKTLMLINNSDREDIKGVEIKRSDLNETKEYVIIGNLSLNVDETKTIYLEKKNTSSNGVCVADMEVENYAEILDNCVKIKCPGNQEYGCKRENSTFIISGLSYSGVVEDYLYCGDGFCDEDESCSSCEVDCGECPDTNTGSSGGIGGSEGGGSSFEGGEESVSGEEGVEGGDFESGGGDFYEEDKVEEEISKQVSGDKEFILIISGLSISILVVLIIIFIILKRYKEKVGGKDRFRDNLPGFY